MKLDRLLLVIVSVAIFAGGTARAGSALAGEPVKSEPLHPTIGLLDNYFYVSNLEHSGVIAKLTRAKYAQPGSMVVRKGSATLGDLNGDGLDDAAVEIDVAGEGTSLRILLNDGHRLFEIGRAGGDKSYTTYLRIENGKVLGKLCMGNSDTPQFQSANLDIRVVSRPSIATDTYKIQPSTVSLAYDPYVFWSLFSKEAEKQWRNDKQLAVQTCIEHPKYDTFYDEHLAPDWTFPVHSQNPVVIVINGPGTYIKTSSGDPIYDSIAYGAIAAAAKEALPQVEFLRIGKAPGEPSLFTSRMRVECTILDDYVQCRELPGYEPIPINLKSMIETSKNTNSYNRTMIHKLTSMAKNFRYECDQTHYQLRNGVFKQPDASASALPQMVECKSVAAVDLNEDGAPDLVAHLVFYGPPDNDGSQNLRHFIVPLINNHGRLEQLPKGFIELGGDAPKNVDVTSVNVDGKKIVVLWTRSKSEPPSSYATVLELKKRVAIETRLNGKIVR